MVKISINVLIIQSPQLYQSRSSTTTFTFPFLLPQFRPNKPPKKVQNWKSQHSHLRTSKKKTQNKPRKHLEKRKKIVAAESKTLNCELRKKKKTVNSHVFVVQSLGLGEMRGIRWARHLRRSSATTPLSQRRFVPIAERFWERDLGFSIGISKQRRDRDKKGHSSDTEEREMWSKRERDYKIIYIYIYILVNSSII